MEMLNGITSSNGVIEGILFYIQYIQQELRSVEFIFASKICNRGNTSSNFFCFSNGWSPYFGLC